MFQGNLLTISEEHVTCTVGEGPQSGVIWGPGIEARVDGLKNASQIYANELCLVSIFKILKEMQHPQRDTC